ncbi:WD40 domain containing protein [Trichuris trichiura]|uniref:WD40 domain containing protein n=1 Tax=Trichuris trichiura TaxID=36087 RepID=A0A077YY35_TRITR|nr:WD40 domain containing protein [Trichuris trichiura]
MVEKELRAADGQGVPKSPSTSGVRSPLRDNVVGDFSPALLHVPSKHRTGARAFYMVQLETVIGLTADSSAALDCRQTDGTVAYPAGCTVVLLSADGASQSHIVSSSKKAVTSLSFSPDGRYLATAECGHQPAVRIWDLNDQSLAAELFGHTFGIACVLFSPNMRYFISVGNEHDLVVNVWDWKNGLKVASNKVACKVMAASFSEGGEYFVTAGVRHVKFWYLERSRAAVKLQENGVPLQGRSAILADQRNNNFRDVCCGRGDLASNTYAITQLGLLCQFNSRRQLEKWVELKAGSAGSMCLSDETIFVGCSDGILRVFDARSLHYIATLPKPHYLGVDVAAGLDGSHMMSFPVGASFPDIVAVTIHVSSKKVIFFHFEIPHKRLEFQLTCIYSDHSLYMWDVADFKQVGKVASLLAHSGSIWAVDTCFPVNKSEKSAVSLIPPGTFVTCSTDDTIRIWSVDGEARCPYEEGSRSLCHANIYSNELMKIIYCDPDLVCLRDAEMSNADAKEKTEYHLDGRSGVRSIKVSPDCHHLASGDRNGNIRIYSMEDLSLLHDLQAHDGDVLCLEYCPYGSGLLASASRDRLLHVLDVSRHYEPVCTIDDHSSSITSVKFVQVNGELRLLSCGADKSIVYRRLVAGNHLGDVQVQRIRCISGATSYYDIEVDEAADSVYAACQDRQVRVYTLSDGKQKACIKGSLAEDGTVIKVELDPSGSFIATSSSDKNVYVFDVYNGNCVAVLGGHGELVTGIKFLYDCRHLVTVSGDSCIFVWQLDQCLSKAIMSRLGSKSPYSPTDVAGSNLEWNISNHFDKNAQMASSYPPNGKPSKNLNNLQANDDDSLMLGDVPKADDNALTFSGKWSRHMAPDKDHSDSLDKAFEGCSPEGQLLPPSADKSAQSPLVFYLQSAECEDDVKESEFKVNARSDMLKMGSQTLDTVPLADGSDEEHQSSRQMGGEKMKNGETSSSHFLDVRLGDSMETTRCTRLDVLDPCQSSGDAAMVDASPFNRNATNRQSLTSRFLNRSGADVRKPIQHWPRAWHSPIATHTDSQSRPSTSPSLASSLSAPSSMERPESDRISGLKSFVACKRDRNEDIGQIPSTSSSFGSAAAASSSSSHGLDRVRRRETYEQSELHARSRSPAYSLTHGRDSVLSELCKTLLAQELLSPDRHRLGKYASSLGDRSHLTASAPPGLLKNSISMMSLSPFSNDRRQTTTMKRLSNIREKLRKSQENLASAWEGSSQEALSSGLMNRSRSTASLQRGISTTSLNSGQEPLPIGSRRHLARSVGYLPTGTDEPWVPRQLSETLRDLERLSRTDLTGDLEQPQKSVPKSYTRSITLPRFYRVSGPAQRKAHQVLSGCRTPTEKLSVGDSEESQENCILSSTQSPTSSSLHRYASPRRRHGSNVSAVERFYEKCRSPVSGRELRLSDSTTQRLFESLPGKRQSYLSKLLLQSPGSSAEAVVGRFGAKSRFGSPLHSSDIDFDRRRQFLDAEDIHYEKMDGHCKESADGFMKALDKVLHAFNMILEDGDLGDEQKEHLVALLTPKLELAQKRLTLALRQASEVPVRLEPVGDTADDVSHGTERF